MTKSSRQFLCRRRMDPTIRRPRQDSTREQPLQVPRRRRTRKSRRLSEVTSWKRELPHFLPRATKISNSCRYVKSKPPKAMPGGRVISSGQGTLTEVSRSFYVAYGTTALNSENSQGMNINLVVPVRDELQEVTDEEMILETSTSSYQLPSSEDSNKTAAEIEMESSPAPKECELPIHDHPCMSMVILDSPRMPPRCVSESIQSDPKNAAYRSFVHCCLPSEEMDRTSPTHFASRLDSSSNAEGQFPMTYVPSTPVQYELTPPAEFALPVHHGTESEGWYGKRVPEASWEPYLSGRNRTQMSIQEACRYRTVSERPYSQAPSGGGYFGVLNPEMAAAVAAPLNEKKHEPKLNKRHQQSLLHTRASVWNGSMQPSSDGYHPYHPDLYLTPHFAKASSQGASSTPPCRILELDPFNATTTTTTSPSLRAYDTSLCRQYVAGAAAANQNCWTRNGVWDYSTLPSILTTTENHFFPSNTNLLI